MSSDLKVEWLLDLCRKELEGRRRAKKSPIGQSPPM